MTVIGMISLAFFVAVMVLTLLRKINLPVQTVLVLTTLIILAMGGIHRAITGEWAGIMALPNETMGWIILHPVTALLAGLFLAGALKVSGGFEAFKVIIMGLQRVPILGMAGTLVILIQTPMIASLPCGRIIAAALLPLLFAFGSEGGMNVLTKSQMIVLIGAFGRNAFGSCGPSPIGGVGQIGEGFLGAHFEAASAGILRAPQAFALMLGTAVTALFLKFVSMKLYPKDVTLRDKAEDESGMGLKAEPPRADAVGYASLVIFVFALLASVFEWFGKVPVQTILTGAAILIVLISRGGIRDLLSGIILLPVAAMISGFMAAGALAATGGFDALGFVLSILGKFPLLGIAGMLAIFVQIQTILPLSCSRILTAALVPVLYLFGPGQGCFNFLTWEQLAIVMAAYIINATTSCGPSPLGGGGMMNEGQMRAETGYIKGAYTFTSMAVMAPLAALYMKFANLGLFQTEPVAPAVIDLAQLAAYGLIVVAATVIGTYVMGVQAGKGLDIGVRWQRIVFMGTGAFGGAVLAFSVYGFDIVSILQGGVGGLVAALLIAVMVPTRLTVEAEAA